MRPALLSLSRRATTQLRHLLRENAALGMRLGVQRKGCNGLSYVMNYVHDENDTYEKVTVNDIVIYIEPKALLFIIGTEVDFVETKLQSEFTFTNPNATGTCGCGESFSL